LVFFKIKIKYNESFKYNLNLPIFVLKWKLIRLELSILFAKIINYYVSRWE